MLIEVDLGDQAEDAFTHAFCNAFSAGENSQDAVDRACAVLVELGYKILEVDGIQLVTFAHLSRYDDETREAVKEVGANGTPLFGNFNAYDPSKE